MTKLFGNEWTTEYPELYQAINSAKAGQPPSLPKTEPETVEAPKEVEPEISKTEPTPSETSTEASALSQKEMSKINPKRGLLNKAQFRKLKNRMEIEPKIKRRVSQITGKPEGQLVPNTRYDYKQIMALKKLVGESVDFSEYSKLD
jgi:hypothetical protein